MTDGDGRITVEELGEIMRSQGQNPTEADLHRTMKEADADRSGAISLSEFLNIMAGKINDHFNDEEIENAFKLIDKDRNGIVSATELKEVMSKLGGHKLSSFVVIHLERSHRAICR